MSQHIWTPGASGPLDALVARISSMVLEFAAEHSLEQAEVRLELADGEVARVSSRRGSVEAPLRIDPSLRPGLAFMTFHFPDQVDTNILTIDATDPKSGTAEFKASAVQIEKISESVGA